MIGTIAILITGAARALIGTGKGPKIIGRWSVYPPAFLFAGWAAFGVTWWALAFAVVGAATFIAGYTDWFNRFYMAARYGAAPLVLSVVHVSQPYANNDSLIWAVACIVVGFWYGDMKNFAEALKARIDFKYMEQVPEFIAGAVLGSFALL